jgi:hypothetical protein
MENILLFLKRRLILKSISLKLSSMHRARYGFYLNFPHYFLPKVENQANAQKGHSSNYWCPVLPLLSKSADYHYQR